MGQERQISVTDTELMKLILVKDFDYFMDKPVSEVFICLLLIKFVTLVSDTTSPPPSPLPPLSSFTPRGQANRHSIVNLSGPKGAPGADLEIGGGGFSTQLPQTMPTNAI